MRTTWGWWAGEGEAREAIKGELLYGTAYGPCLLNLTEMHGKRYGTRDDSRLVDGGGSGMRSDLNPRSDWLQQQQAVLRNMNEADDTYHYTNQSYRGKSGFTGNLCA